MGQYAQTILAQKPSGLAAITVSEDGGRIAQRFGMRPVGEFKIGNELERIFAVKF